MLSDTTIKIKTKLLLLSGISLFVGITKTLPTKLSLIGLNFEDNQSIIGWFLFAITLFLFFHFTSILTLDITNYFKNYFIQKKSKKFTGNTIGFTYNEIGQEYDRQKEYEQYYIEEKTGSLSDEINDINNQIKELEKKFTYNYLTFKNIIEIIFNVAVPIIFSIVSLNYLYDFLIISQ